MGSRQLSWYCIRICVEHSGSTHRLNIFDDEDTKNFHDALSIATELRLVAYCDYEKMYKQRYDRDSMVCLSDYHQLIVRFYLIMMVIQKQIIKFL